MPPDTCPPTLLDSQESKCQSNTLPASSLPYAPPDTALQARRHESWAKQRQATYEALRLLGYSTLQLSAFLRCGSTAWLMRHRTDPTHYKFALETCRFRLCRPCALDRSRVIRANLETVAQHGVVRFLTLTLRSTNEPLRITVARLHKHFRTLRRRSLWRDRVVGGAAFLEVTRNHKTRLWHAHLHCLLQGHFIPRSAIAHEWLSITGDSYIVDIRLPHSQATVANYVTKYVTKPFNPGSSTTLSDLVLAAQALEHTKLAITFGRWRKLHLLTERADPQWTKVEHTNMLCGTIHLTEAQRTHVLEAWALYCDGRATGEFHMPPPLAPDTS